jgi:hypothetical protein
MDKAVERIQLHLGESLKQAIQDAAMEDDRAVSEWIRHQLSLLLEIRRAGIRLDRIGPGCQQRSAAERG